MTAVCGIYHFDKSQHVNCQLLNDMLNAMAHRGTLGKKLFDVNYAAIACRVNKAQYRVNTVPLNEQKQNLFVVADGLLFNTEEILQSINISHCLKDRTELSEVVACLYEEHGVLALNKLDGAFSIAILDCSRGILLLARDRYGCKPLYYFVDEASGVVFSSEIKGILASGKVRPSVNLTALQDYLLFRYCTGPETMFNGIREIVPGHVVLWDGREKIEEEFWSAEEAMVVSPSLQLPQHINSIENLLWDSIRRRVKLGENISANCSGGIDSGLVTSFSSILTEKTVSTYCVGFEEQNWDERHFASLTARKYETEHHELVVTNDMFSRELEKLNWHNDEPLSDPNSVLVFLLAEHSCGATDLLLTGEGADEVFMGYPRYNLLNIFGSLSHVPVSVRNVLSRCMPIGASRRIKKLATTLRQNEEDALIFNSAFVPPDMVQKILNPEMRQFLLSYRRNLVQGLGEKDLITKCMLYEIRTYLMSSLNRLDKMNMAVGLEAVTPFLANELFEYALSIPRRMKIGIFENKIVLKRLAQRYLPIENLKMPKSGFGVPISDWFRKDAILWGYLEEIKNEKAMQEFFWKEKLEEVINQHLDFSRDNSELLWLITNFYLWSKQFLY